MDKNTLKEEGKKVGIAVGDLLKTVKAEITTKNPDQPTATETLKKGVNSIKGSIANATAEKEFSQLDLSGIDMSSMKFYKSTKNFGTSIYEPGTLWNSDIAVFCGKKNIAIPNPFYLSGSSYGILDFEDDTEALEECFEIEYPKGLDRIPLPQFIITAIYPAKLEISFNNYLKLQKKGKIILNLFDSVEFDENEEFVDTDSAVKDDD